MDCNGCLPRRTVVVGAVALAGAAAGCARYGGESAPPPAADEAVLGKAADVPVGGGTVFRDQKIVVTQPTAGEFLGFSAVCTHQGCIVADVDGGTINCTCHGSSFGIADGAVAGGPAGSPLPPEPVTVTAAGDLVLGGGAVTTPAEEPTGELEPRPPARGLASTGDIPVGGGTVFSNEQVVITQPTAGEFLGFSAVCTHQGCSVANVDGGTINCTCHGSKFRIADGSVANGPARDPLPSRALTVDGDQISLV